MKKVSRKILRNKRRKRVKSKVSGSDKRPRISVFRSSKSMSVQVIDDSKSKTLAAANLKETKGKNSKEGATELGKLVAKKCIKLKISEAVFDRGGYKYHGKVKNIAEGLREGGINI